MSKERSGLPHDSTPDVHRFQGQPANCFDLVNQYGTYNIQPTSDTDNLFPLIGAGLPQDWKDMKLDKYDLEPEE